jgi:hypothetical protein
MFTDPKFVLDDVNPGAMIVRTTLVVAVNEPDVPVTSTLYVPAKTELFAERVNALAPVAGFGIKDAVTPVGSPDAATFTLPVNPFWPVTATVDVPEAPWTKVSEAGEALRVKLGAGLTVSTTVVDAISVPEVPVMVTVAVPIVAELLAVSVITLVPEVGLVANPAVTPLGRPDAARVTLPANPFWPVTVIVDVPEAPWITVNEAGEALRVKLGGGMTVKTTVVLAVIVPSIPVIVAL